MIDWFKIGIVIFGVFVVAFILFWPPHRSVVVVKNPKILNVYWNAKLEGQIQRFTHVLRVQFVDKKGKLYHCNVDPALVITKLEYGNSVHSFEITENPPLSTYKWRVTAVTESKKQ